VLKLYEKRLGGVGNKQRKIETLNLE